MRALESRPSLVTILLLAIFITACGGNAAKQQDTPAGKATLVLPTVKAAAASPQASTPNPTQAPAKAPPPTQSPKPAQPPAPGLVQVWTMRTGDLFYFGVAGDGTIYGLGNNLYAVISPEGQVVESFELNLANCVRHNFAGGAGASGDSGASMWFMIQPEGFMSSNAGIGSRGPCTITPGSPPRVQELPNEYEFSPLSTDGQPRSGPDVPEGFKSRADDLGPTFVQDSRRNDFDLYINQAASQLGFLNRNNGFSVIDLPTDLDLEKNRQKGTLNVKITPWDDVYILYQAYDGLGNATAQSILLVKYDGTRQAINKLPVTLETLFDRRRELVAYDRLKNEQYYKSGDRLERSNEDYQVIASFTLPAELVRSDQNLSLWVGHDHAFYVFHKVQKTLTKYQFTNDPQANAQAVASAPVAAAPTLPPSASTPAGQAAIPSGEIAPSLLTSWIAYIDQYNVWLVHPDGSGKKALTSDGNRTIHYSLPRWAPPNGERLAFLKFDEEKRRADLIVHELASEKTKRVTANAAYGFDWYDSGMLLVFDTPGGGEGFPTNDGLWQVKVDTLKQKRLLSTTRSAGYILDPQWSPDGDKILYTIGCFEPNCLRLGVLVFNTLRATILAENGLMDCAWSPDSSQIACGRRAEMASAMQILLFDAQGRLLQTIEPETEGIAEFKPLWSPDGSKLALSVGDYLSTRYVEMLDLASGQRTRLAGATPLAWSPDGQYLLVGDQGKIKLLSIQGEVVLSLASGIQPDWQPLGK